MKKKNNQSTQMNPGDIVCPAVDKRDRKTANPFGVVAEAVSVSKSGSATNATEAGVIEHIPRKNLSVKTATATISAGPFSIRRRIQEGNCAVKEQKVISTAEAQLQQMGLHNPHAVVCKCKGMCVGKRCTMFRKMWLQGQMR